MTSAIVLPAVGLTLGALVPLWRRLLDPRPRPDQLRTRALAALERLWVARQLNEGANE